MANVIKGKEIFSTEVDVRAMKERSSVMANELPDGIYKATPNTLIENENGVGVVCKVEGNENTNAMFWNEPKLFDGDSNLLRKDINEISVKKGRVREVLA